MRREADRHADWEWAGGDGESALAEVLLELTKVGETVRVGPDRYRVSAGAASIDDGMEIAAGQECRLDRFAHLIAGRLERALWTFAEIGRARSRIGTTLDRDLRIHSEPADRPDRIFEVSASQKRISLSPQRRFPR